MSIASSSIALKKENKHEYFTQAKRKKEFQPPLITLTGNTKSRNYQVLNNILQKNLSGAECSIKIKKNK